MKKSEDNEELSKAEIKLVNDLLFNKRKRRNLRMASLRVQKYILENSDFTEKPTTKEEYEERAKDVENLSNSIGWLSIIKDMQTLDKELQMIIGYFKLYKKERKYIIANTYKTHDSKKKINKTFHYMPNGFPIKKVKIELKYRDKFEFSDYELIDEGIFKQVLDEVKGSKISYKGEVFNFRIKYHQISSDKKTHIKTNRIRMMRFKEEIDLRN